MTWYVFKRMTPSALQRLDGRQGGAYRLEAGGDGSYSRAVAVEGEKLSEGLWECWGGLPSSGWWDAR